MGITVADLVHDGQVSRFLEPSGCEVWQLPPDRTCAAVARRQVRRVLQALQLPEEMITDATTVVSELAANVHEHTLGGRSPASGPMVALPELYLYRRGVQPEIVVKVFDSASWRGGLRRAGLRPDIAAESGRGLEIVDGLVQEHGGQWGVHRTRSRLASTPVSGKVAYFTLPVPVVSPVFGFTPARLDSAQAIRELERALGARGLGISHHCEAANTAVLSVRPEITVCARQDVFCVTMPSVGTVHHPLTDVTEVAEAIVQCNEDLNAH